MPNVPHSPNVGAPITDAGKGSQHQIVLAPYRKRGVTTGSVPPGGIRITGHAPVVWQRIAVPAGAIRIAGHVPTVVHAPPIPVPASSLVITGYAPGVVLYSNTLEEGFSAVTGTTVSWILSGGSDTNCLVPPEPAGGGGSGGGPGYGAWG